MKVDVIKSKEDTLNVDEALNVRGGLSQALDGSEVDTINLSMGFYP